MTTPGVAGGERNWSETTRAVAWSVVVAAAVGGVIGIVVGGVGGRVLMLVLRLTSDVDGLTSDDGFEIGRVSIDSLNLLAFGAAAGVVVAGLYVLLRPGIPRLLRVPTATAVAASLGGATFIRPDGIDLRVLEPTWLALTGFIVLPGLAGLLIALAVERADAIPPWSLDRRHLLAVAPAVVGFPGLILVVAGGAAVVVARRLLPLARLAPVARYAVPSILVFALTASLLGLIDDISEVG